MTLFRGLSQFMEQLFCEPVLDGDYCVQIKFNFLILQNILKKIFAFLNLNSFPLTWSHQVSFDKQ